MFGGLSASGGHHSERLWRFQLTVMNTPAFEVRSQSG